MWILNELLLFTNCFVIQCIYANPVQVNRLPSDPNAKVVRYGDELFLVHVDKHDDNKNKKNEENNNNNWNGPAYGVAKREAENIVKRSVENFDWPPRSPAPIINDENIVKRSADIFDWPPRSPAPMTLEEDIVKRSVESVDLPPQVSPIPGLFQQVHIVERSADNFDMPPPISPAPGFVQRDKLVKRSAESLTVFKNQRGIRSSSKHPGKSVVKIGDQLFIVNENSPHDVKKRSSETSSHDDIVDVIDGSTHHTVHKRAAIKDESYRWKDKTVPYSFDDSFYHEGRKIVKAAMDEWARHTCVKFRPARRSDDNQVKFVQGDGCYSFVGMVDEGVQDVSLESEGCRYVSTALHEIGHALGMYHTQVRPDRDQYIKVDLSDVKKNLQDNFIKQTWETAHHYGVDYDFKSIMHYDGTSFTSNGGTSIKTLDPKWQKIIGNAKHLSFGDIEMMNKMYHCAPASCKLKDSDCPGTSFVGMTCKCMCPGPSDVDPVVLCTEKNSQVIESKDGKDSKTDKNSNENGSGSKGNKGTSGKKKGKGGNKGNGGNKNEDEWGYSGGGDDDGWNEWTYGGNDNKNEWEDFDDNDDNGWEYYR